MIIAVLLNRRRKYKAASTQKVRVPIIIILIINKEERIMIAPVMIVGYSNAQFMMFSAAF